MYSATILRKDGARVGYVVTRWEWNPHSHEALLETLDGAVCVDRANVRGVFIASDKGHTVAKIPPMDSPAVEADPAAGD